MIDNGNNTCEVKLRIDEGTSSLDVNAELITHGYAVELTPATTNRNSPTMDRSAQQALVRGLAIAFPGQGVSGSEGKSRQDLPKLPLPMEDFRAVVVIVNDPGSFYIQVASKENAEVITNLGTNLNAYYSQEGLKGYRPSIGELCAAQFSQDHGWYRARAIEETSSDGVIKVLFVDFGNEETVHTNVVRELSLEFRKIPIMAQHCSLAGVLPSLDQGGKWSSEVIEFVKSKVILRCTGGFTNQASICSVVV